MRKLILATLLILGLGGLSFAFTAVNTGSIKPNTQKSFTGLITAILPTGSQLETAQATIITGLSVTSGATADVVGLYDWGANSPVNSSTGNTPINPPNTSCVFEASAAANTTTYFDFSNAPIRTLYGLEAAQSQSTGGFIVYTVQSQ